MNIIIDDYVYDRSIYNKLYRAGLFSQTGLFQHVWINPNSYLKNHGRNYIVTDFEKAVAFLSEGEFFLRKEFKNAIGLYTVYVKPEFRNQGIAKNLTSLMASIIPENSNVHMLQHINFLKPQFKEKNHKVRLTK